MSGKFGVRLVGWLSERFGGWLCERLCGRFDYMKMIYLKLLSPDEVLVTSLNAFRGATTSDDTQITKRAGRSNMFAYINLLCWA